MVSNGIPQSVVLQKELTDLHIEQWLSNEVFHARWWTLIGLLAAMFIAWLWLADKAKMKETCLFLVLAIIVALGINEYGEELVLWDFPTDILPIFPPLTSVNLICAPLAYSIAFQRFPDLKRYAIAVGAITAAISFVLEPLLVWGGFYRLLNWRHIYSFLVYFVTALVIRCIAKKIIEIENKARRLSQSTHGRAEDEQP